MQLLLYLLGIVVLVSLGLNLALFVALNRVRRWTVEGLIHALKILEHVAGEVISFEVKFEKAIPVRTEVLFQRTLEVPVKVAVPIDTELDVPVRTLLGTIKLRVPIDTELPIDLKIPVPIDEVINVDTEIPVQFVVPVDILLAQTSLAGHLAETQQLLARLQSNLEQPLVFRLNTRPLNGQLCG